MRVFWGLKAATFEKLEVDGQGGDPFIAAHNMRGAHEVIIHCMGKVVGWDAVRFEQNDILRVFWHFDLALMRSSMRMRRLSSPGERRRSV